MNELRRQGRQSVSQRSQNHGNCGYCGMPLNAFYYFCVSCGTPYKEIDTLITAASPPVVTEGELIRMKAPSAAPLFWTYFSVILFGGILAHVLFTEERPDLAIYFQDGLIFITTCIFGSIYWRSLVTQFKRLGFDRVEAWIGLVILVPMLAINYLYNVEFLRWLLPDQFEPTNFWQETGLSKTALVITVCVFPAITEEIAFRGLLQHWLQLAIHPHRALAVSAFLFAAMHVLVPAFLFPRMPFWIFSIPYLFGVGVLLGWVKWKTESLYPSMVLHFLHNFVVIEFFHG